MAVDSRILLPFGAVQRTILGKSLQCLLLVEIDHARSMVVCLTEEGVSVS